jgi:predicted dehydrogenase
MTISTSAKIRVGLIGAGNWANHAHFPVLRLLPEYELTVVQARRREAAETAAARFGIKHVVDTPDEVAAHPEVDFVVALTTTPQHEEAVRLAAAAGKHIYSEWPLTVSAGGAARLQRLAEQAGVYHFIGLQRRLTPAMRYLRDLVAGGYVGKLRSVRIHVSMPYFQARMPQALRWTVPPENGTSVITIYAGHFLDMLFSAVGKPSDVNAVQLKQYEKITIAETGEVLQTTNPDQLAAVGRLADGAVFSAHIEGGKRNGSGVRIDITGHEGDLRVTNTSAFGAVGDDYLVQGATGDNGRLARLEIPDTYGLAGIEIPSDMASSVSELAHLYRAIAGDVRKGSNDAPSFADAVWMHRFLDALKASSETGNRSPVAN